MKWTLITIWVSLTSACQCFAWGKDGHHIVAEVAMQHMNAATKGKVAALLGTTSPNDAATWMDDIRSNHAYDYMRPWHYIDFPKDKSYPAATEENAVTEMTAAWLELRHRKTLTPDEAKVAVMILFHLTGDLHQPLHAGYAEDRGGNSVQVQFDGKNTNLHSVWDEGIIQQQGIKLADVEAGFTSLTAAEVQSLQRIDIVTWMDESRLLLPAVYSFKSHTLDAEYSRLNKPTIEKQLLFAGLRLAALLESALSDDVKPEAVSKKSATVMPQASSPAKATPAGSVSAADAPSHIGEELTVCSRVFGGKYLGSGSGVTFINVGAAYPNSPFSVVIFKGDRRKFSYMPEEYLDGKDICVSGRVREYKGKPEIIINSP